MAQVSQLNLNQREHLEALLNHGFKLVDIANSLDRDPRGIKYEIIQHRQLFIRKTQRNKCGNQDICKKKRLCNDCDSGLCKYCHHMNCNHYCELFQEVPHCKTTSRFPCVCNACPNVQQCTLPKFYYKAATAQKEYEDNISSFKKGPLLDVVKLKELDKVISDGVKRGLSIEVIIHTNKLDIAPSTVYRYINDGLFSIKNIDLKRKVRYRTRITHKNNAKPREYDYLKGRTYSDFCNYLSDHLDSNIWQLDTIEGKKGGAAVMSLLFTKTNLQLFFKIESICQSEIIRVFDCIKKHLGDELFSSTFSCILTDNGKEFRDPKSIEDSNESNEKLIHVFFCESRRSDQKGKCERNHEHFREFIPKGKDMDHFGQKTINSVSLHVNNYPRKQYQFRSPYESSVNLLHKKVFELNKLTRVPTSKLSIKHITE